LPLCGVVLSVESGVVGVVPWIVVFVPFVLVVLESMVAEPLTELESLPEDPMSSELVLHPATRPSNANAAKNCFIVSFVCVSNLFARSISRRRRAIQMGEIPQI
jgi:hypothetical protein